MKRSDGHALCKCGPIECARKARDRWRTRIRKQELMRQMVGCCNWQESKMDEEWTNELIERCEKHLQRDNDAELGNLARDDIPALIRVIRERQQKDGRR